MKGEIKKLKMSPLTLDDNFTRDGLEAISILTGKEPYYVVGGVATQSYLPTSCRRPTSDIDMSIVRPLNYEDFKQLTRPIIEYLLDKGYNVETKKGSRAFSLDIRKGGTGLLIEMSRRNEQSFEKSKRKLERELTHSKRKIIENRKSTYSVAAPEDIVVPKLVRSINSLIRNPEFIYDIPYPPIETLNSEYIKERLSFIGSLRETAMDNSSNLNLFEKLKFVSDTFDIRVLSEITGVNVKYFNDSKQDWRVFEGDIPEIDVLSDLTLPIIYHK